MQPDDVPPVDPAPASASPPANDHAPPPTVVDPNCDATGEVISDIQCRHCGYALRGLNIDGRCPECGTSVGWSIRGNLLQYSDPVWVERLANGTIWLIVSALAGIVCNPTSSGLSGHGSFGAEIFGLIVEVAIVIIWIIGIWLVTAKEPGNVPATEESARSMTRFAAGAMIATGFIIGAAYFIEVEALSLIALIFYIVAAVVLLFSFGRYAQLIAARIPNPSLVRQTRNVVWGSAAAMGLLALAMVAGFAITFEAAMVFGCIGAILGLVFGLWGLVLLFLYRAAMVKAARQARSTWAAAQG